MKGKNKYLPVCAAMYANYAAHGFGLIILTQTAAWLMEKFNTDMGAYPISSASWQ